MGWIARLLGRDGVGGPKSEPLDTERPPAPESPANGAVPPPANGRAYTLDELLAPHQELLASLVQPCVDIAVAPVPEADCSPLAPDGMEARASKLGGTPFTPFGKTWPVNRLGHRLPLVAQVNFAETPPLEGFPPEGILQVFESEYGTLDDSGDGVSEYGLVRYINPAQARASHVPAEASSSGVGEEEASVTQPCRMRFALSTSEGSTEDASFSRALTAAGLDVGRWWETEAYETAHDQLYERFDTSGHRLGGYASFTQYDPPRRTGRPRRARAPDRLRRARHVRRRRYRACIYPTSGLRGRRLESGLLLLGLLLAVGAALVAPPV